MQKPPSSKINPGSLRFLRNDFVKFHFMGLFIDMSVIFLLIKYASTFLAQSLLTFLIKFTKLCTCLHTFWHLASTSLATFLHFWTTFCLIVGLQCADVSVVCITGKIAVLGCNADLLGVDHCYTWQDMSPTLSQCLLTKADPNLCTSWHSAFEQSSDLCTIRLHFIQTEMVHCGWSKASADLSTCYTCASPCVT